MKGAAHCLPYRHAPRRPIALWLHRGLAPLGARFQPHRGDRCDRTEPRHRRDRQRHRRRASPRPTTLSSTREGMAKGAMRLLDAETARRALCQDGAGAARSSGGSAANTLAGSRRWAADAASSARSPTINWARCSRTISARPASHFKTRPRDGRAATARCLILVTPDAQRTMNTFLGAVAVSARRRARRDADRRAGDPLSRRLSVGSGRAARRRCAGDRDGAGAGRKVAFTLSDGVLHRPPPRRFPRADRRRTDRHPVRQRRGNAGADRDRGFRGGGSRDRGQGAAAGRDAQRRGRDRDEGREAHAVAAEPMAKVVDTTGAGDLFAAGFLAGQAQGRDVHRPRTMGAIAAAEVISH